MLPSRRSPGVNGMEASSSALVNCGGVWDSGTGRLIVLRRQWRLEPES